MSFEYASELGWPMPTQPVYGAFGAIRCKDLAHPENEWVYMPMDSPRQASERMQILQGDSRFSDLSFIISPRQAVSLLTEGV